MPNEDDEIFEEPFPTVDAMRPYVGKVVGYDDDGVIRLSADSWKDLPEDFDEKLTLMYIPDVSYVG